MKATKLKCPKCGAIPTSDSWEWSLIEPAVTVRRLAIEVDKRGDVVQVQTQDLEYDDADGTRMLSHIGCATYKIPKGFWDFDVYG